MTERNCWNCGSPAIEGLEFCPACRTHGDPTPLSFGRYLVDGELGSGAYGIVYSCQDPLVGRRVAVKKISRRAYSVIQEVRELQVPGRLQHKNIIEVFDVLEHESAIVMEFAEGGSLRDRMRDDPAWVRSNFLQLMRDVCEGLRAAHSAKILHLDIKPDNILLSRDGVAKIGDFGVSKLVESSEYADGAVGTPPYMAVEALDGQSAYKTEADVHSLGCLMYEILAGRLPWVAHGNVMAWLIKKTSEEPVPLMDASVYQVDDLLSQLVSRMITRGPSRIKNIDIVLQQLLYLDPEAPERDRTIDDLQVRLGAVYGFVNAERSPLYLLSQYLIAVRSLSNALRTDDKAAAYALFPKAFAWLCASATAVNLRLGQMIWLKYDVECPYCGKKVCECPSSWQRDQPQRNEHLLQRLEGRQPNQAPPPKSFYAYRATFDRLFGAANRDEGLDSVIGHNYSEIAEAMDAVIHLLPSDDSKSVLAMQLEFSDLIAWYFALLNLFDNEYDLPQAVLETFSRGCYACETTQCSCPEPLGVSNWRLALGAEHV